MHQVSLPSGSDHRRYIVHVAVKFLKSSFTRWMSLNTWPSLAKSCAKVTEVPWFGTLKLWSDLVERCPDSIANNFPVQWILEAERLSGFNGCMFSAPWWWCRAAPQGGAWVHYRSLVTKSANSIKKEELSFKPHRQNDLVDFLGNPVGFWKKSVQFCNISVKFKHPHGTKSNCLCVRMSAYFAFCIPWDEYLLIWLTSV